MAVVDEGSSKSYEPAPPGLHHAVCVDVFDRFDVPTEWGPKDKTTIIFEIAETVTLKATDDHPEREARMTVWSRPFTQSLHEKSNLRPFLESWRGKPFEADDLPFDMDVLIGAPCQINVIHKPSPDGKKIYANIAAIMPVDKDNVLEPSGEFVRMKDRDRGDAAEEQGIAQGSEPDDDLPF